MDLFEFVLTFFSIIIGLGIAEVLQNIGRLLKNNHRCNFYWVHFAWLFIIVFYYLYIWLLIFILRERSYSELWFCVDFMWFASMFLLTVMIFPDFPTEGVIDLRRHYFEVHRLFFGVWAVMFVFWALDFGLLYKWNLLSKGLFKYYIFIALSIAGATVRNERFHAVLPVLFITTTVIFFMILSPIE